MTYVTFSGEWDGRRLTVGTFKSCSRCGRAYDDTNSCQAHDGGEGESLILEAVVGRRRKIPPKEKSPVRIQDSPAMGGISIPQYAWHCTNCGRVGYGPYSFEQYGRYGCPPPEGWWRHTNHYDAKPEILVACSDACRIALEAKYLNAPAGFLARLCGGRR